MKTNLKQFATMKFGFNSLQYHGAKVYNHLSPQIKQLTMAKKFLNAMRKWDVSKCFNVSVLMSMHIYKGPSDHFETCLLNIVLVCKS